MSITYDWYYSMWKATSWVGPNSPDIPYPTNNNYLLDNENDLDYKTDPNPEPTPPPPPTTSIGYLCFGIHLKQALYVDPEVCKVLRVYPLTEIQRNYPGCTKRQLNTFRNACNIGIFKNADITIEAVDEHNVYPLFGKKHSTSIVISSCAVLDEVSLFFADKTFKVGPNNILYKVVPGTFKVKRNREKPIPVA